MIKVIIAGVGAHSRLLRRLVEVDYNPCAKARGEDILTVVAFFDMFCDTGEEKTLDELVVLDRKNLPEVIASGQIGAVLLPEQPTLDIQYLMHYFRSIGIYQDSVYFAARSVVERKELSTDDAEELLVPYAEASYLPYLEFHIEDSCNMNCSACEHYSPLVERSEASRMDYDVVERDLHRLKELIERIGRIRILGGEPLLNPELDRYIRLARSVYPSADIFVVTNALLLMRLSEEAYNSMRECNAVFEVSYYPPLEGRLSDMTKEISEKGIRIQHSPLIREFSMRQNLHGNNDPVKEFDKCFQSSCNNLYKGKIAPCMLPFTTHYFNEVFDKQLPEDGAIDLYDETLTTRVLKERLERPFSRCAYCGDPVNVPWKQVAKEPDINDYIMEE